LDLLAVRALDLLIAHTMTTTKPTTTNPTTIMVVSCVDVRPLCALDGVLVVVAVIADPVSVAVLVEPSVGVTGVVLVESAGGLPVQRLFWIVLHPVVVAAVRASWLRPTNDITPVDDRWTRAEVEPA